MPDTRVSRDMPVWIVELHFSLRGVDGTDATIIVFDRDQLGLTPYVNVPPMSDRHHTLLIGEPTNDMVGPFEAEDANVHTIRSRCVMFIPFELVALLLGKDLTAREAYLVVYPLLEDNDLLEACRPLIEFLQVASTQPNAGNPCPVLLQELLGKVDYSARAAIIRHRHTAVL
jgi:hypothetical protein